MEYALKERIGNPDLFTGRKEELTFFLKWINDIKEEKSQSTAILARRKMGKTAVMERLFNITFFKNDGVIPFYYEVKENKMWVVDFCQDFFLTFIYQYIAFKSRKPEYLVLEAQSDFDKAVEVARKEGFDYLIGFIESAAHAVAHEKIDILWNIVRRAPANIAAGRKEFVVQMIDGFQFLNAMIYWDKNKSNVADTLAGGYLSSAESKVAPLLVSGSWVGWLMNELIMMLPARFAFIFLENMPQNEAVEMVFNYSRFFDAPVSEETAYLITEIAEGSPFYTSSLFRSNFKNKDLASVKGLKDTLEFETLNEQGRIKSTWMEYISTAFKKVNGKNVKNIVLYLCKHKDREVTRKELLDVLKLDMSDVELEKKLKSLVKADIIKQGASNFRYRGVNDNLFDKVFRGVYEEEIRDFDASVIREEINEAFEVLIKKHKTLRGKYNYQKGYFAEYLILDQLKFNGSEKNELLKSVTRYLPADFNFCDYKRVWRYDGSPEYGKGFNVDIFAIPQNPGDYAIIGEVKSRESRKFSRDEVISFEQKFDWVKKMNNVDPAVGFIFSRAGFTKDAENYCKKKGIAC
ncbi:MAG: hypothetical protein GY757_53960, partial [bacterium]|nr:hypothetical protein [bacterium]